MVPFVDRLAHAKVNLALSVGAAEDSARGRLHPISSWMSGIDLADEVSIRATGEPSRLTREWRPDAPRPTPFDWSPQSDLALRALRLLEDHQRRDLGLHVHLRKRIPIGSGLGGGSSDAATVLLAARELLDLDIAPNTLIALGASLGSDIPFFLDLNQPEQPRPAIVSGFGEQLERVSPAPAQLLLIIPDFGVSTGDVYQAFDALPQPGLRSDEVASLARAGSLDARPLFNDLLPPAEAIEPRLGALRQTLEDVLSAPILLSGSGSTLFALVDPANVNMGKLADAAPSATFLPARLI